MRERTENELSKRIAGLAAVEPGPHVRNRVLAAMATAAAADRTGDARPAVSPPDAPVEPKRIAIAAGVAAVALLTGLLMIGSMSAGRAPDPAVATSATVDGPEAAGDRGRVTGATAPDRSRQNRLDAVAPLIEASWVLERALDELPAQRRLMRVGTASTIAALETQIALIDEQLGLESESDIEPEVQESLWRERVDAMSALYQVRYGQSRLFTY